MTQTKFIKIEDIIPNRYQPRLQFDEKSLNELSQSIIENGLIQPITVRPYLNGYELVAGERRYRACVMAGFKEIPCLITTPSEESSAQMALVENIQREDLTAIEEAKAYIQIMRQASITQEEMAKKIGKSQSTIANKIRLLSLPMPIQQGVMEKLITERHARAMLQLDAKQALETFDYVVHQKLNVRDTEQYIDSIIGHEKPVKKEKAKRKVIKGFARNIQIGLNSIQQCITMIKKTGIEVSMETKENDDECKVIIRFPKK